KAARCREHNGNDASKLLAFFTSCKKENPQFFSDSSWTTRGRQLGDYIDFSDAVTFDTTHKTNLYDKLLCMFVGVNHHLQCVVFGLALLGDETVETFEWVFNAFKTCMGTEGPRVMLTAYTHKGTCMVADQDPAMPIALRRVFRTQSTDCVSGMFMPFLNELYARFEEEDFKTQFQSIIHHPLTP
ncbi:hypothetical protein U9M48_003559, partial [Paspalum notatum var. saurae]